MKEIEYNIILIMNIVFRLFGKIEKIVKSSIF